MRGSSHPLGVIGSSFVVHNKLFSTIPEFMLMRFMALDGHSDCFKIGDGVVVRGLNHVIRRLVLSAPRLTSGEGKGAGD